MPRKIMRQRMIRAHRLAIAMPWRISSQMDVRELPDWPWLITGVTIIYPLQDQLERLLVG
jgi:hypothetical protein